MFQGSVWGFLRNISHQKSFSSQWFSHILVGYVILFEIFITETNISLFEQEYTLPETNIALGNRVSQKDIIFQTSIFVFHVCFRGFGFKGWSHHSRSPSGRWWECPSQILAQLVKLVFLLWDPQGCCHHGELWKFVGNWSSETGRWFHFFHPYVGKLMQIWQAYCSDGFKPPRKFLVLLYLDVEMFWGDGDS